VAAVLFPPFRDRRPSYNLTGFETMEMIKEYFVRLMAGTPTATTTDYAIALAVIVVLSFIAGRIF
jgi:hypothetical protein